MGVVSVRGMGGEEKIRKKEEKKEKKRRGRKRKGDMSGAGQRAGEHGGKASSHGKEGPFARPGSTRHDGGKVDCGRQNKKANMGFTRKKERKAEGRFSIGPGEAHVYKIIPRIMKDMRNPSWRFFGATGT